VDLVPVFEEHSVRLERGVSIKDWMDMDETEKALIVARRRIATQMRNLQTEAEIRKAKQDANKHGRK
jgi:hypothetical protein